MRHTYYPPAGSGLFWRLPVKLPGRKILAAIWAWL